MLENEAMAAMAAEKEMESGQLGAAAEVQQESAEPSVRFSMPDFSFLLAKTGDGSIEDYIDHPLNRTRSHGVAQMLRGFTGILGETDYAIVDIALGAFEVTKERKNNVTDQTR